MIVADTTGPAVHLGPGTRRVRTRCLARRGMLHSECEAIDHVRIGPGACFGPTGRDDSETAWYVLGGLVVLPERPGEPRRTLARGDLLLAPHGSRVQLRGGPFGAELLCLTLLPEQVSSGLPPRSPDLLSRD